MNKKPFYKKPAIIFGGIIFIFIVYTSSILVNIWPIDSTTLGQAGVFGDSFGVLTSLFSALAFGCIIITIWQQQFEKILLRMLDIHNKIIADFDMHDKKTKELTSTGRDCFWALYGALERRYKVVFKDISDEEDRICKMYGSFWNSWQKDLGHYFRYLYNIFKHIDSSFGYEEKEDMKKKRKYANLWYAHSYLTMNF